MQLLCGGVCLRAVAGRCAVCVCSTSFSCRRLSLQVFDLEVFMDEPEVFYGIAPLIYDKIAGKGAAPSLTHRFIAALEREGCVASDSRPYPRVTQTVWLPAPTHVLC